MKNDDLMQQKLQFELTLEEFELLKDIMRRQRIMQASIPEPMDSKRENLHSRMVLTQQAARYPLRWNADAPEKPTVLSYPDRTDYLCRRCGVRWTNGPVAANCDHDEHDRAVEEARLMLGGPQEKIDVLRLQYLVSEYKIDLSHLPIHAS